MDAARTAALYSSIRLRQCPSSQISPSHITHPISIMPPMPTMPATLDPRVYHGIVWPGAFSSTQSFHTARSGSLCRSPVASLGSFDDFGTRTHRRRHTASVTHPGSLRSHASSSCVVHYTVSRKSPSQFVSCHKTAQETAPAVASRASTERAQARVPHAPCDGVVLEEVHMFSARKCVRCRLTNVDGFCHGAV